MVRYEGPLEHPALAIRRVLEALGLAITPGRLERAVRFSSFSELSGQERRGGFSERPVHSGNFFRQGISGSWPTALRRSQIERLSNAHGNVMRELGASLHSTMRGGPIGHQAKCRRGSVEPQTEIKSAWK